MSKKEPITITIIPYICIRSHNSREHFCIYIAYGLGAKYMAGETDTIAGIRSAIVSMCELLGCSEFRWKADIWNSVTAMYLNSTTGSYLERILIYTYKCLTHCRTHRMLNLIYDSSCKSTHRNWSPWRFVCSRVMEIPPEILSVVKIYFARLAIRNMGKM